MKATIALAAAAALVGDASAERLHGRHAHEKFHGLDKKGYDNGTCGCTTIWSTWTGAPTLVPVTSSPAAAPTTSSTSVTPVTHTSVVAVVPTPAAQTISSTGVYTFPATTLTLTETTTVLAASTTSVPVGTHTLGGVTTVVETETTVVCPFATVSTSQGVTTSVLATTTYVCPSAGTYTIAPITTTVTTPATVAVPVVATYTPGTYTQPEVVTTITETSTVVYCPFAESTTSAPATTATPVAATTSVVAVPTTTAAATAAATTSASKSSGSTASVGGSGKGPWAISYTPYTSEGGCKSQSEVDTDIAAISLFGIEAVRVYSTDCSTLEFVGNACANHGLKMILGIYIDTAGCEASSPSVSEQISAIKSWAQWDLVELVTVGNEAFFNGYCTASQLSSLISEAKSAFSGYTGAFTTAEVVSSWQQEEFSSVLCDAVDITGANVHAFFNTDTSAPEAGSFVKGQLSILGGICSGKEAKVLETGWPSKGNCLGKACPGVTEQVEAIASLVLEVADDAVFFSFSNDAWKSPDTACGCEQYWGCASALGF